MVVAKWWWPSADSGYTEVVVAVIAFWQWVSEVGGRGGGAVEVEWWREMKEIKSSFSHIFSFI